MQRERARNVARPALRLAAVVVSAVVAMVGAPGPLTPQAALAIPAIIQVTTTADAEFPADGLCSLRAAILASNVGGLAGYCSPGTAEKDSIRFSLGSGTPVIPIGSNLPAITQPVTIAGNTGGATRIRLQGPGSGTGLTVNGATSTIRNLVVDGFATGIDVGAGGVSITASIVGPNTTYGIYAHGGSATIGGTTGVTPGGACTGDCNLISGNGARGLYLAGSGGIVQGNFIGTNAAGSAASANGTGLAGGGVWTIGGTATGAGNLVSGNSNNGLQLFGCHTCFVQGNKIGTNVAGTSALPNGGAGIYFESGVQSTIGGSASGAGNLISGNGGSGIELGEGTQYIAIHGNRIGTTAGGSALGNGGDGIHAIAFFSGVHDSAIGSATLAGAANTIAYNEGAGILIGGSTATHYNEIRANSIYSNLGVGIRLIVPANDSIMAPLITSLGPVTGTACASCAVDVYSDNLEEGRIFHGTVMADPAGNWTYPGLFAGPNVTATATTFLGNTSEFSAPFPIPATPFTDIASSPFKGEIEWLYANRITTGCSATKYCPTASVTREQMASFIARMFKLPATGIDFFDDDDDSIHEADINRLAAAEITTGCTATTFCPKGLVLRDQMASFLARAADLTIGAGRDYFNDDDGNQHEANIDRNAAAGIASGCGSYLYCPSGSVTREQMAAFLRRVIAPVPAPPYPAP